MITCSSLACRTCSSPRWKKTDVQSFVSTAFLRFSIYKGIEMSPNGLVEGSLKTRIQSHFAHGVGTQCDVFKSLTMSKRQSFILIWKTIERGLDGEEEGLGQILKDLGPQSFGNVSQAMPLLQMSVLTTSFHCRSCDTFVHVRDVTSFRSGRRRRYRGCNCRVSISSIVSTAIDFWFE